MADRNGEKVQIVNVSVEETTRSRLKDYCETIRPRVFMTDAATVAIDEWLDKVGAKKNG